MSKKKTLLLSLLVMLLWGSLFPCIKIGYAALGIDSTHVADILMFAALRFTLCGLAVSAFCLARKETYPLPSDRIVCNIVLVGVFAIVLHYACTYIGLSTTDSSKTALLKQIGTLLYVCFAFLFFKDERFSPLKILGAVIGFCGILVINRSPEGFTLSVGDVLILAASVCTVISNVISRYCVKDVSPFWVTGISQLSGGAVLLIAALFMGGSIPQITVKGVLVFLYICAASVAGYTLWYYVLEKTELSKLFIIKFAEPVFACVFSAILLGENIFRWEYLAAFALISLGIFLGQTSKKEQVHA